MHKDMEALFDKITAIDNRINEVKQRIENTRKATHWTIFGTESKREKDICNLRQLQKRLLSKKYKALESLQIAINLEKYDVSEAERQLILNKKL